MVIRDLCLNLSPQKRDHKPNYPINLFFQSLADDLQEKAIGIVLSGTGSDGSQGLQCIHESGGNNPRPRPQLALNLMVCPRPP